jgi:hypothetical protein
MVPLNVDAQNASILARVFGCHLGSLPFTYLGVSGVEIPMGVVLSLDCSVPSMPDPAHNAASVDVLSSGSASALPALGFTLFLSNLQVSASHATLFFSNGCSLS